MFRRIRSKFQLLSRRQMEFSPAVFHEEHNLQAVGYKERYRCRDERISELAFIRKQHRNDVEGINKELHEVRLRSIDSEEAAFIYFYNDTKETVRAIWLDFSGHEIAYHIIKPGRQVSYHTYTTHPWIVREVKTGNRLTINQSEVVLASGDAFRAVIKQPPLLKWTESRHTFFPHEFKCQVREVLLCHKYLRKQTESELNGTRCKSFGGIPHDIIKHVIAFMGQEYSAFQTLLKGLDAAPDLLPVELPINVPIEKYDP